MIYKRYSSFDALNEQLQKYISENVSKFGPVKLPPLPSKRLTRVLAQEFVERRRVELQEYLCNCLITPKIAHCEIMLNFLEVPDSVRPMLYRQNTTGKPTQQALGGIVNQVTANHSVEEAKVLELLCQLRYGQTKVAALRHFETWYFTLRPRLSAEYIRKLFEGVSDSTAPGNNPPGSGNNSNNNNNNNAQPIGLVQTCGDFRHSRCASRTALYLLSRLLDPEKNKESAICIDQLASLPSPLLQKLRLHMHILSSRGNRPAAFNILYLLQQHVETHFSSRGGSHFNANNDNQSGLTLELLVQDTWARHEYLRWLSVRMSGPSNVSQQRSDIALSATILRGNALHAYKQLVQQGFQQLLHLCSLESGWQDVEIPQAQTNRLSDSGLLTHNKGNSNTNNNNNASNRLSSAISTASSYFNPNPMAASSTSSRHGISPASEQPTNKNLNISLTYQRDVENNIVLLRSCVLLNYSVNEVISLLTISDLLALWDEKIHAANVAQHLDSATDVLHLVFTANTSFYAHKDFCLLRCVTQLHDGSAVLLYRSIAIPSCAEVKGYHRCTLPPSGFIVSPISESETLLTMVLQLDDDGVLIYASDLLGESQDLQVTWENFSCLLAQQRQ